MLWAVQKTINSEHYISVTHCRSIFEFTVVVSYIGSLLKCLSKYIYLLLLYLEAFFKIKYFQSVFTRNATHLFNYFQIKYLTINYKVLI